jgi:zinc/manganese transport system permease protein
MVGPAATAQRVTGKFGLGVLLSVGFAVMQALCGVALAYLTDWPTSFWISVLSAVFYASALGAGRLLR